MNEDIYSKISEIRRFISKPQKKYALILNMRKWEKLCSSMDCIEDSQLREKIKKLCILRDLRGLNSFVKIPKNSLKIISFLLSLKIIFRN
ncbi:hypothetical protein H8E88_15475 [candidate division KSB1 bacterium]|nr:hypothetical protein [candidate division KSB1 bacterium]